MKKSRLRKRSILKKARDFAVGSAMYLSVGLTPLLAQQGYIRGLFEGEPIPDATVELNGSTATTNEEGYFQFETSVGETPVITIPKPGNLRYKAFNTLGQEINGDFYQRDNQVYFTPENNIANGMLLIQILGDNFYSSAKALKMGSGDIAFNADRLENKVRHNGKNGRSMQSLDEFSEFRVNADGYYPRVTFVNPGFGDLINETMVDSASFPLEYMEAYNQMTGRAIGGGTKIWIHPSNVYIVTGGNALPNSLEVLEPRQEQIDSVLSVINEINDVKYIINENIEYGENPPFHYNNQGLFEPDSSWHLIFWASGLPGPGINGAYFNQNNPNIIQGAITVLSSGLISRGVYMEEILQPYLLITDNNLIPESVFYDYNPDIGPGENFNGILSYFDKKCMIFGYSRPPENLSPDTDVRRYVELMSRR